MKNYKISEKYNSKKWSRFKTLKQKIYYYERQQILSTDIVLYITLYQCELHE